MAKRPQRRGPQAADHQRHARLFAFRENALRAQIDKGSQGFADPAAHRLISQRLYTACLTSPRQEGAVAVMFWRAYRHIAEGRTPQALPSDFPDRDAVVDDILKILRGEAHTTRLDAMETDEDE